MKIKKLVLGGLLLSINILLPYIFHFLPNGGRLFLPMHLGVMVAGLLLGPGYGAIIGMVSPLLGFLITQMPAMPLAVFMMFELAAYGACGGLSMLLFQKIGLNKVAAVYISLLLSMLVGRLIYAGILLLSSVVMIEKAPAAASVLVSFLTGLPGIAIQLVLVPILVLSIQKIIPFDRKKEQAIRY